MKSIDNDEHDGVAVDPAHHRVLFENEFVRVIESVIPVAERTSLHTHHQQRVMLAMSGSSFVRRDADGMVIESAHIPEGSPDRPRVMWAGRTELHTIENTGPQDLAVIAIEILCAGGAPD